MTMLSKTPDIHYRRLELLRCLHDEEFKKPIDMGSWDGSYHSADLRYLVNAGLAELGGYLSLYRRVNRYRRSSAGRDYLESLGFTKHRHGFYINKRIDRERKLSRPRS